MPSVPSKLRVASGLSSHPQALAGAAQACEQVLAALEGESPDLAFVFFSAHHVGYAPEIAAIVRRELSPGTLLGVSTKAVIGGAVELERVPGVSILALRLPGARCTTFTADDLYPADDTEEGIARVRSAMGLTPDHHAAFFFADPFSVPLVRLIPVMNQARESLRGPGNAHADGSRVQRGPLVGGMASAAKSPGGNALILNDRVMRSGGVGVSIAGPGVCVDTVLSQGCRPFGPAAVITKAKGNVILELGGRPTPETVRAAIDDLWERAKDLLKDGLLIGLVINEYKDRFGRDDFLIRNVLRLDASTGGIAVADVVRVGQTVRFHHRDAATASEDLGLLLDAQRLYDRPAGCLLITCNERGQKLFGTPHHDAAAVARAFAPLPAGEQLAKGGEALSPAEPGVIPLAGFFAAGEIGPVGGAGRSFVHGHTVCAVLFREA